MITLKNNFFWLVGALVLATIFLIDRFVLLPFYGSPIFSLHYSLPILLLFLLYDLLLQRKNFFTKLDNFIVKIQNYFDEKSFSMIILFIFLFSLACKLFYLKFNLSTDYISVKSLFDAVYYRGDWFSEMDDSPIHTAIGVLSYYLFGPEKMEPIVFFQIILGSFSVVLASVTFYKIFNSKFVMFFIGIFLALYIQSLNWEAVIRYDTLSTMFHVLGIFGLFLYLIFPNPKNLFIFLGCLFLALLGKETVIYMLPFYLGLILVNAYFNDKIKIKSLSIALLLALTAILGVLKFRDSLNVKHFGVTSIKKPIVLLWNMQMFNILKPDMPTKYPELRNELWDYHRKHFTQEDDDLNIIQKTQKNLKYYHEHSYLWFYQQDNNGKYSYIKKYNPILEESKFTGFFLYLKNSIVRYFYDVNSVSCALPKESFQRIHDQMRLLYPLKILNCNILPLFGRGYWFFCFLFIYLLIRTNVSLLQKINASGLALYSIYFGVFLSAATVSEYHRLMLPVHFFMLPVFILIFYLLYKIRKDEHCN